MADTNPALETTQRETIPLLTKIRDELMIANGKGDLVIEMRKLQEKQDELKALQKERAETQQAAEDELNELVEQNYLKAVDQDSTFGKMLNFLKQ